MVNWRPGLYDAQASFCRRPSSASTAIKCVGGGPVTPDELRPVPDRSVDKMSGLVPFGNDGS